MIVLRIYKTHKSVGVEVGGIHAGYGLDHVLFKEGERNFYIEAKVKFKLPC